MCGYFCATYDFKAGDISQRLVGPLLVFCKLNKALILYIGYILHFWLNTGGGGGGRYIGRVAEVGIFSICEFILLIFTF